MGKRSRSRSSDRRNGSKSRSQRRHGSSFENPDPSALLTCHVHGRQRTRRNLVRSGSRWRCDPDIEPCLMPGEKPKAKAKGKGSRRDRSDSRQRKRSRSSSAPPRSRSRKRSRSPKKRSRSRSRSRRRRSSSRSRSPAARRRPRSPGNDEFFSRTPSPSRRVLCAIHKRYRTGRNVVRVSPGSNRWRCHSVEPCITGKGKGKGKEAPADSDKPGDSEDPLNIFSSDPLNIFSSDTQSSKTPSFSSSGPGAKGGGKGQAMCTIHRRWRMLTYMEQDKGGKWVCRRDSECRDRDERMDRDRDRR